MKGGDKKWYVIVKKRKWLKNLLRKRNKEGR